MSPNSDQGQTYADYRSKYLDLYDKVKSNREKERVSILDDLDFEIELITRDKINVSYILELLKKISKSKKAKSESERNRVNTNRKGNPGMQKYKRLSRFERDEIGLLKAKGFGVNQIARILSRDKSTISREIKRNTVKKDWNYYPIFAQELAEKRKKFCRKKYKLETNPELLERVIAKLKEKNSPKTISMTEGQVSHETIYRYLYVKLKGSLKQELTDCLKTGRRKRKGRRFIKSEKGQIPDMTMIKERPPEIAERRKIGHWEGDLMIGKGKQSALGVLVEMRTRYLRLVPLKNRTASHVREEFERVLDELPEEYRLSMTYDQGKEMSEHKKFKIKVYFCEKASPWQKGAVENMNGHLRWYLGKDIDFREISNEEIYKVQDMINSKPRAILNWQSPKEAFEMLKLPVALAS